jgi:TRAP transporter TAXI family solute receptor
MTTARITRQGILLAQVVVAALLIASCAKEEAPLFRISTGGAAGTYRVVGRELARVVNENQAETGFRVASEISSGSVSNINAIASGEAQFGVAQADHQYQAVNGEGEWKEQGPQDELRAVFSMYTESVTLLVGGDTDIREISDLKGKHVDIGAAGSGTRRNAIDVLRAAGIDWQNDIQAREESLDDRLAKFMGGELDAFFYTAGHPNKEIKFATFSVRGVRIIPLENIDDLISENPYFLRTSIPTSLYPMARNEGDIQTIGVNATLLTSVNVPDDVVYAFTKSVLENLGSLIDSGVEFDALLDDEFLQGLAAPIHPGALRYFREIGLDIPSR